MFLKNDLQDINNKLIEGLSVLYDQKEAGSIANLLLEHLGYSKMTHIKNSSTILGVEEIEFLENALGRLQNNEPVQYVLGKAHFYGMELIVNSEVLIPRQETEELVNLILKENKADRPGILDIGTGSGCIALSLKRGIPESKVDALDVSPKALDIAMKNAKNLNLNIHFHHLDILHDAFLPGEYDIIVSNPPYVTESEKKNVLGNVLHYEPHEALFISDQSPLIFYECIVELAARHLNPNGKLYFEINEGLGEEVRTLLTEAGYNQVRIIKDLNMKNRIVSGSWQIRT